MPAAPVDLAPISINLGAPDVLPVTSNGVEFGPNNRQLRHSGNLSPSSVLFGGGTMGINVVMPIKQALDRFPFGQLTPYTNLITYLRTFDSSGNPQSGANHISWTSAAGVGIITSFSASPQTITTATVRFIPFSSNDIDEPLVEATGVSLPTISAEPVLSTMANMVNNNVILETLQSLNVELGQDIHVLSGPNRYPRQAFYQGSSPVISGEVTNTEDLLAITGFAGSVKTTNLDWYLRENDEANGTLLATGIRLRMANALIETSGLDMAQNTISSNSFTATGLEQDPLVFPIAYSASETIPV